MKADLHMHTIESDGRLTREALFQKARDKHIDIIAITDHDVCRHVKENYRLAQKYGIQYLPAIELSTLYDDKSVHVLGYFKNEGYRHEEMLKYYDFIKKGREQRAKKFIRNLKKHFDIHITYDDLLNVSDGIIARPHIAKAIIKHYPEYTHNEVFNRFIGEHSKAYVPSTELSVSEGIELLRRNGAITVLAHPALLNTTIHDQVLAFDYDGIEAIYGMHDSTENKRYLAIASQKNLLVTAGSDYHGVIGDTKHKELGDAYLEGEHLKRFLKALS